MTVRECLHAGEVRLLSGPHPERARRDAESLFLYLTGKDRAWLIAHSGDDFGDAIRYTALLERRFRGEPIQYITRHAEFYGLPFRVTPDVLIPRPETEHLVERAISLATDWDAPHILDIGAGSGAIAIALAHSLPHARITAVDVSRAALEIARANAAQNSVADRVRFEQSDLLAGLGGEQFHLIVSNPPYVPEADRSTLAIEVREHEPALALFAGKDGLEIYRRLIPAAARSLVRGGFLLLEIGFGQSDAVGELFTAAGFTQVEFTPDLQGIPRIASAQLA